MNVASIILRRPWYQLVHGVLYPQAGKVPCGIIVY